MKDRTDSRSARDENSEALFNFEGPRAFSGEAKRRRTAADGGVAQLGEHLPCKQGVDSSNLFISTRGLDERSPDRVLPDMGS